jgi:ABC-type sugar transport system permease subunit
MIRQLRDFAIAGFIALLIATAAFVAVRNRELSARQVELATRSLDAVVAGRPTPPDVHAVIVSAARPSEKHPTLRRREVLEWPASTGWRPLAAGGSPDDKLIYDAAARLDRNAETSCASARAGGEALIRQFHLGDRLARLLRTRIAADACTGRLRFQEMLRDSTGRAIAVGPIDRATAPRHGDIAIAITTPTAPAPYPWLVIIGVFGLGAALAAAGALAAGGAAGARRKAELGTFAGIGVLAIPCILWGAPIATTAILILGAALALAQHAGLTDRTMRGLKTHRTALSFLAPAAVSMLLLVAAPFVIGLVLGFYDHHQGQWTFVGLDNFGEILSGGGRPLDDPLNFWFILGVTVLWTIANVALHVSLGVILALALSRSWLRGKGVLRMLFILPWAVPNYITALIWKGIFENEHGAMASILEYCGLENVDWFGSWATSFSANVITNTWLGFPFMMVVALGALETIPKELYEAASVDGASAWQRFRHITMPHLKPALGPAVALGSIWTFNMFNVIFLVSKGDPGGSTNILVTDAYRWAFERGERYGMAAAYATIIFLILLLWTVFGTRIVRSKGETS